jgi:hypothetical protein
MCLQKAAQGYCSGTWLCLVGRRRINFFAERGQGLVEGLEVTSSFAPTSLSISDLMRRSPWKLTASRNIIAVDPAAATCVGVEIRTASVTATKTLILNKCHRNMAAYR